jgi:hypothetical protein
MPRAYRSLAFCGRAAARRGVRRGGKGSVRGPREGRDCRITAIHAARG